MVELKKFDRDSRRGRYSIRPSTFQLMLAALKRSPIVARSAGGQIAGGDARRMRIIDRVRGVHGVPVGRHFIVVEVRGSGLEIYSPEVRPNEERTRRLDIDG